jgi:hypothetical protein
MTTDKPTDAIERVVKRLNRFTTCACGDAEWPMLRHDTVKLIDALSALSHTTGDALWAELSRRGHVSGDGTWLGCGKSQFDTAMEAARPSLGVSEDVIERVAAAISPNLFKLYPAGRSESHEKARDQARAAILAMQSKLPTEAFVDSNGKPFDETKVERATMLLVDLHPLLAYDSARRIVTNANNLAMEAARPSLGEDVVARALAEAGGARDWDMLCPVGFVASPSFTGKDYWFTLARAAILAMQSNRDTK